MANIIMSKVNSDLYWVEQGYSTGIIMSPNGQAYATRDNGNGTVSWCYSRAFTTGNQIVTSITLQVTDCEYINTSSSGATPQLGISQTLYNTGSATLPNCEWIGTGTYESYNGYNSYKVTLNVNLQPNTNYYIYAFTKNKPNWGSSAWTPFPNPYGGNSGRESQLLITFNSSYTATYTVTFNANGGTGAPASQTKTYGINLTLSTIKPTKSATTSTITTIFDGNGGTSSLSSVNSTKTTTYTFNNWKATDGSTYSSGGTYIKNESTTMTAQWRTNNPTYSTFTAPTATRDGYIFVGWSYDKNATSGTIGTFSPTNNGTMYAIWEENTVNENLFIKINNKWISGIMYIKVNNEWKLGTSFVKVDNTWYGADCECTTECDCYVDCDCATDCDCTTECDCATDCDCASDCDCSSWVDCSSDCDCTWIDCSSDCDCDCYVECEIIECESIECECTECGTHDCECDCITYDCDCDCDCYTDCDCMSDCGYYECECNECDCYQDCDCRQDCDCQADCDCMKDCDCHVDCDCRHFEECTPIS